MLININQNLNFKDDLKMIISLGIDTVKVQIKDDMQKKLFSVIKHSMEDYIVIIKENNTENYIIYDNSKHNIETNNGTTIGRIYYDMITLYGLNQINYNENQYKILNNIFLNYDYQIRQLDFNIDIFGLPKDRLSCVYNTTKDRFHISPNEQLKNNYFYINGIGTTKIAIPDNKKHSILIKKIKAILKNKNHCIYYVKINIVSIYKSFKIVYEKKPNLHKLKMRYYSHILFKIQEQKHFSMINKLISEGDFEIDYNPLLNKHITKMISKQSSKKSLIKFYDKVLRYKQKMWDELLIQDYIYKKIEQYKHKYIFDENEFDDFKLQYPNNWFRIEYVMQFNKGSSLTFESPQINHFIEKAYKKMKKIKLRIFNIGQRKKSKLYEYIKLYNAKSPKEIYNLKPIKNNFYEYQPTKEEIGNVIKNFYAHIQSFKKQ